MILRTQSFTPWLRAGSDLFAVLTNDGLTLNVGWRTHTSDATPVLCAVATLKEAAQPEEWQEMLGNALRLSEIGRDRAARAAAYAMVQKHGGEVHRHEDREPALKVC